MRRACLVLACLLPLAACDSSRQGLPDLPAGDPGIDPGVADPGARDAGHEVPENPDCPPALAFQDPTGDDGQATAGKTTLAIQLSLGGTRDLKVVVRACGEVSPDQPVEFEVVQDVAGSCELESDLSYSGADGGAVAKVKSTGKSLGCQWDACTVRACPAGAAAGACLTFDVKGDAKCVVPLVVAFQYAGSNPKVDVATASLFRVGANGKPRCADLDPDALPTATAAAQAVPIQDTASFAKLPDLDTQKVQTYTVVALAAEGTGPTAALACSDAVRVESGASKIVTLALHDLPPSLLGTFDVRSWLDVRTGLPPDRAARLDAAYLLANDPARGLLMLACATPVKKDVSVSAFCTWAFDVPGTPSMDQLTPFGEAVKARVEGFWPATSAPVMQAGAAGDPLRQLGFLSDLACSAAPTGAGAFPDGACTLSWRALRTVWKGRGCPAAGCDYTTSFTAVPGLGANVVAPAPGRVDAAGAKALWTMDSGDLALKHRVLAGFALEKLVLPTAYGNGTDGLPAVDSFEALIGAAVGGRACLQAADCCDKFATAIVAQVSTPGLTKNVLEGACNVLAVQGPEYLRTGLVADDDAADRLVLGTVPGSPCPGVDANWDGKVETLGTASSMCRWLARWSFGLAVFEPDATFQGIRK